MIASRHKIVIVDGIGRTIVAAWDDEYKPVRYVNDDIVTRYIELNRPELVKLILNNNVPARKILNLLEHM